MRGLGWVAQTARDRLAAQLMVLVGEDAAPCFSTDDLGQVLFSNDAAKARFGDNAAATLVAVLA